MSKYREVTRAIEAKVPGPPSRAGAENNRWAEIDGRKILRVTYPKVHSGDIPKGTLNQIRKQLRLDRTQFEEFVRCTMSLADYETHLRLLVQAGEL